MILNHHKAPFILFEGIDGSGKSSVYDQLKKYLSDRHPDLSFAYTKEPNENRPIGAEIYQIIKGKHPYFKLSEMEAFLMQAFYIEDRMENYRSNIIPALQNRRPVLQDRGAPSSVCYGSEGSANFKGFMALHDRIFSTAQVPFIWPDLIIVFDVPAEMAVQRMKDSGKKLDEFETLEKLTKVRQNYLEFVRKYANCVIVDGRPDEQTVFVEATKHIFPLLGIKLK